MWHGQRDELRRVEFSPRSYKSVIAMYIYNNKSHMCKKLNNLIYNILSNDLYIRFWDIENTIFNLKTPMLKAIFDPMKAQL